MVVVVVVVVEVVFVAVASTAVEIAKPPFVVVVRAMVVVWQHQ